MSHTTEISIPGNTSSYLKDDARTTTDRLPIAGYHVIEYDPDISADFDNEVIFEGVIGAPYSFRAYDITAAEGLKLLEYYKSLMNLRN